MFKFLCYVIPLSLTSSFCTCNDTTSLDILKPCQTSTLKPGDFYHTFLTVNIVASPTPFFSTREHHANYYASHLFLNSPNNVSCWHSSYIAGRFACKIQLTPQNLAQGSCIQVHNDDRGVLRVKNEFDD